MPVISLKRRNRTFFLKCGRTATLAVSEWRKETAADLEGARKRLEALADTVSGEPGGEQLMSVWLAYLAIEKSIAFIRFDFDEENPGRFVKLKPYSVPDERQALQFSLRGLRKGEASFAVGDFTQALKELRESRNYLRALLREKQLKAVRRARKL